MFGVKLYKRVLHAELSPIETLIELQAMLKKIEARWDSGSVGNPEEIVKLDRQMKELKRKIRTLSQ